MHEKQIYRKHSDEFREVIERFPKRSNDRLLILLLSIVVIGFLFGWFIKSPDVILAEIKVTAEKPPIAIVAKIAGNIKLKIFDFNKIVEKGEYIAIIENNANEDDMLQLKRVLENFSLTTEPKFEDYSFALKYNLGEIQVDYLEFITTIYEINQVNSQNKYELEIKSLKDQKKKLFESIDKRYELLKVKDQNIKLSESYSKNDSILVSKGAIPKVEFESSKKILLKEIESSISEENEIIKDQLNIVSIDNKITSLNIENTETIQKLNVNLLTNYQKLIGNILLWEQNYVLKAPIRGKLERLKFVSNSEFIKQGEATFSVLPENNNIIGQAQLPSEGAGKVKPGQKVSIKLDTYPYQEFGIISGEVKSISLIPLEKTYLVSVQLPNGLVSDNKVELNFSKEMSGQAEIITEKRRLISRLFERLKYIFEKDRKENIIPTKEKKQVHD